MARNVYEGMFILDSNRYGRDPEGISGQATATIEKLGGEILVSRLWEERRLAYPIKGHRKGTYWLTYFRLESGQLATLRRQCEINENLVRFLFLKIEPRIVDALVAHAQSAPLPTVAPAEEAAPAAVQPAAGTVLDDVEIPEELDIDE
ncbi:MAG: 30S ribosomal protein S6 [Thermoguttaceae bacterium]